MNHEDVMVSCPFCNEADFDLIGLKIHINSGHCERYDNLPKFARTYCSHCGGSFGPGDHGFSHCQDHGGGLDVIDG